MNVVNKTCVVTGGSSGIGRALALQLVDRGARVVIVGRKIETLKTVALAAPQAIQPLQADLSQPHEVEHLIATIEARYPDVAILFNNAGEQHLVDFTCEWNATARETMRAEAETNFQAVVALSHGLLPHIASQREGAIVNITSGLALAPKASAPLYCATKAGIRAFTRALRYQCEKRLPHIRIIEALPPLVDTPMTAGRGSGKISASDCAVEILTGVQSGKSEIYVGKSKLLYALMRLAPDIGYAIMKRG